jgi:hypothetical protein
MKMPRKGLRSLLTRRRIALLALLIPVSLLLAILPASAANPAKVRITLIPAITHDLPLSGQSYTASSHQKGFTTSRHARLAAPDAPDASWNCTVYASDPFWSDYGYVIGGEGSQFCSGTGWAQERVRVAVQWYLGAGLWSNRARDGSSFTSSDTSGWTTYYDCSGTGTHTYRIVVDGYARSGNSSQSVQSENDARLTCES